MTSSSGLSMEADDAPPGIESFDGASAAAQQEPALDHQCARRGQKFAFYSHLAFLTKEGQFAANRNTDITRAIEKGAGLSFENKFEGSEVVLTCWQCSGRPSEPKCPRVSWPAS